MTIEQSFLMQILSDHLFQRGTEIPEGLDWTALLALSKKHELSPILYDQCKTAFGAKTEQPAFADDVILSDKFIQRLRTHA